MSAWTHCSPLRNPCRPALCLIAWVAIAGVAVASPLALDNVFDQPAIRTQLIEVMNRAVRMGRAGQLEEMEQILENVVKTVPEHPAPVYNLACAQARLGKAEEALESLARAVELELAPAEVIRRDPDLKSLHGADRFEQILQRAEGVQPRSVRQPKPIELPVDDGWALITESNTVWDARRELLISLFDIGQPFSPDRFVAEESGALARRLNGWVRDGVAAGLHGVLYDNRDSGHSTLRRDQYPQLTFVQYGPEARERRLNWGAQTRFLYNAVTVGNASVASTGGILWGSAGRDAYANPRSLTALYAQYRTGHLYVYPEHKDYDPGHNGSPGGYGDVFAVNTPYVLICQGSSFSDQPFVRALTLALAAFRPEVRERLQQQGLLMPTLQMLVRSATAEGRGYLRPPAHPVVFNRAQLKTEQIVDAAHEMTAEILPPLALLQVVEEDEARLGVDYAHATPSEVLCTTPCAIARVARSMRYERRMVICADQSIDPQNRSLTYHWAVLQGDAERIRIRPLNEDGSVVELRIPYHERFPVRDGAELESNRVDIGAFVHNGVYYSAPAFVSVFYLDNEEREYDGQGRIRSVQYSGGSTPGHYVDPRIDIPKDWRDEFHYDNAGALTGWTRILGDEQAEFNADGRLVAERDDQGRPTLTHLVFYLPATAPNGRRQLVQVMAIPRDQANEPGGDPEAGTTAGEK